MLSAASPLLYIFVTALVTENLVFARAIGAADFLQRGGRHSRIPHYGVLLFSICLPAVMMAWAARHMLGDHPLYRDFRWLAAMLALVVSFGAVKLLLTFAGIQNKWQVGDDVLLTVGFGTTSLAIVLLSLLLNAGLLPTVTFAAGSTLGLTVAILLIHSGRERLEISQVRKSFQGFPISLLYLGILSMAIYGLTGHPLLT